MLVEWLFKINTQDTQYNFSTKDIEYGGDFYKGIIDPSSFSGISESQSGTEGVITPADVTFSIAHVNSVLKDADFLNIIDTEDSTIDYQATELLESTFKSADAEIILLIDGSLFTSWKFKVKRVEQYYKKAFFYLENVMIGYLEGDHPSTLHPREVWKTEYEHSDNYVIPQIFGKAYIPLRSIYNVDTRYYVLGKDLYTYTVDRVSSPKDWGNQSFWDDSFEYPQTNTKGYTVFQAIIADSDGDSEVDANGLWKDGDLFLDMPTRVTSDEIPGTVKGASPVDVLIHFFKDCGIPEDFIDIAGTFETVRTKLETEGIYWNGAFYHQIDRSNRLTNLLSQCNCTIRVTDKIELYYYTTTPVATLTSSDIIGGSYNSRPSWPSKSDGGYIEYSHSEDTPQDRLSEALVWSNSTQNSADDIENPSSNKLNLEYIRDSVVAQKLGIIHYNRDLDVKGSVSFTLMPNLITSDLKINQFVTIEDDLYGNTANVLITSININKDCSINVEATKFENTPLDFSSLTVDPIVIEEEAEQPYWYPSTVDTYVPNKSVKILVDRDLIRFRREDDPYETEINISVVVQEISAHDGVYLEIKPESGDNSVVEMVGGTTPGTYNYQYSTTVYADYPLILNATAYQNIGTYKSPILSSSKVINAIIDGEQGYSVNLSKGSYQVLCDWKGTPLQGELGTLGNAYTEISILKGLDALTPVNTSPVKGQFSIEVLAGEGCTGGKLTDNKTAYINSVSADSGYLPIRIYLESTDRFIIQQFPFVKSLIGRRGSISYSADTGDSALAADWNSVNISDTTAAAAANILLNIPENRDRNIVPGDRLTLQDYYDETVIAQRIYQGVTKVVGDTFTAGDWSSIVVETIDGSLVVKGTLAADSLIADDTLTNNLTVGSVLNVGDATYTNAIIKSYKYNPGVSGWAIKGDGTAEFNNSVFRGDVKIGNASEVRMDINVADGADVTSNNKAKAIDRPDTRYDNSPPSFYYGLGKGTYSEFKRRTTIGAPGSGTYVSLTIDVPWSDSRGGPVIQSCSPGDHIYRRKSTSDTTWSAWQRIQDGADNTKGAIDEGIGLNNSSSAFLSSGNYSPGALGWKITGEGDAEFNSAEIRGNVSASSFTCGGSFLTANAASGTSTLYLNSTYDFPSSGSGWILGSYNDKDAFSWTGKALNRLTGCVGVRQHPNGAVVIPKAPNIVLDKDSKELRVYGYNTSSDHYSATDQLVTLGIKDVGDGGFGTDTAIARFGNETFSRGIAAYFENKANTSETVRIQNYSGDSSTAHYALNVFNQDASGNNGYGAIQAKGYFGVVAFAEQTAIGGTSTNGYGGRFESESNAAVYATTQSSRAIYASSNGGDAIYARSYAGNLLASGVAAVCYGGIGITAEGTIGAVLRDGGSSTDSAHIRLVTPIYPQSVPSHTADAGSIVGRWIANGVFYVYICQGGSTWKRIATI